MDIISEKASISAYTLYSFCNKLHTASVNELPPIMDVFRRVRFVVENVSSRTNDFFKKDVTIANFLFY